MGRTVQRLRRSTLGELEALFASCFPPELLSQREEGPNSREQVFTLRRTFWLFLFQMLTPHTACREVVRNVQAQLGLQTDKQIDSASSAFVQARQRLAVECLKQALRLSAAAADRHSGDHGRLNGRAVKVVDGTGVQLADTPANQRRFPQPSTQKPGCGFPVMKIVALFSLSSGALLAHSCESLHWHDLRLFHRLWSGLCRGDILLGDRAFGDYVTLAMLPKKAVDLICRLHQGRKVDFRKCHRRLGKDDALFVWKKTTVRPKYLTQRQWRAVPAEITVRVLRQSLAARGFRTKSIKVVTTLLDPQLYPAGELLALYRRRWRLELCFRDLKTTMGMEQLRCQSPAMVEKELLMYLIAHNLIRWLMAQAATQHGVDLERVSFKGSVDATRQFSGAMAQARSGKRRRKLHDQLLAILAEDLVPDRPDRREPRAVKHRPKPYPLLNRPRHEFKDIPHRNRWPNKRADKQRG